MAQAAESSTAHTTCLAKDPNDERQTRITMIPSGGSRFLISKPV
jgi:hypothetical protein